LHARKFFREADMCGRFTLKTPIEEAARQFQAAAPENVEARYNISPSQEILAVWDRDKGREMSTLVWGLIPSWSREPKGLINARAETLLEKPSFREAFKRRRCLIPADGFYEWKKEAKGKQPYYFQLKDGELFAFAGIWEEWGKDEDSVRTCAIITTEPNELLSPLHNRMPVILREEDYEGWLGGDLHQAESLLVPYPASEMRGYPVSKQVNVPTVNGRELVRPLEL
jgi:putative SOS response-associated peptidase YedK